MPRAESAKPNAKSAGAHPGSMAVTGMSGSIGEAGRTCICGRRLKPEWTQVSCSLAASRLSE
eukprot:867893-Prorocentrum_lima.AAC.1